MEQIKRANPYKYSDGYIHYVYDTPESRQYQSFVSNIFGLLPGDPQSYYANKLLQNARHKDALKYFKQIAAKEYKIHLQVKPEFFDEVAQHLQHAIERGNLSSWHFKHAVDPQAANKQQRAAFVIYMFGPENIRAGLRQIIDLFRGQTRRLGTGKCLRYNHKVNNLVFYTQGDTDIKDIFHNSLPWLFDKTPAKHNIFSQHIQLPSVPITDCVPIRRSSRRRRKIGGRRSSSKKRF